MNPQPYFSDSVSLKATSVNICADSLDFYDSKDKQAELFNFFLHVSNLNEK